MPHYFYTEKLHRKILFLQLENNYLINSGKQNLTTLHRVLTSYHWKAEFAECLTIIGAKGAKRCCVLLLVKKL